MSWADFQAWAFPASLSALSLVLWWMARGIFTRLGKQDVQLDQIEQKMNIEMRAMDVRLTVIETQLGMRRVP